jgi:hypothetical protein
MFKDHASRFPSLTASQTDPPGDIGYDDDPRSDRSDASRCGGAKHGRDLDDGDAESEIGLLSFFGCGPNGTKSPNGTESVESTDPFSTDSWLLSDVGFSTDLNTAVTTAFDCLVSLHAPASTAAFKTAATATAGGQNRWRGPI